MYQKRIVAAFVMAVAASSAFAELKIYGNVDIEAQYFHAGKKVSDGGSVNSLRLVSGGLTASRLGIIASYPAIYMGTKADIGANLETKFSLASGRVLKSSSNIQEDQLEDGTSKSSLFVSKAYLFLKTDKFGSLSVGRQMTVFADLADHLDPSGGSLGLTNDNLWSYNPVYGSAYSCRSANSIRYDSPSYNGVGAGVLYSTGTQLVKDGSAVSNNKRDNGKQWAAAVHYEKGPLFAGVGYNKEYVSTDDINDGMKPAKSNSTLFGLSYNFGTVQPFASFMSTKVKFNPYVGSGDNELHKLNIYSIGLKLPVNERSFVVANYGRLTDKESAVRGAVSSNSSVAASLMGIGYVYKYNQAMTFYIAATKVRNDLKSKPDGSGYAHVNLNESEYTAPYHYSVSAVNYNPRDIQLGVNIAF